MEQGEEKGGMMLRIEGVEATRGLEMGTEMEGGLEGLVERYMRGLEGLRRFVEGVGGRGDGGGEGG